MIDLWMFLVIYLFVVIILIFILVSLSVQPFDAIMVSLVIGMLGLIVIIFFYHPDSINNNYGSSYAICLLIIYATFILILFYIAYTAIINTKKKHTYIDVSSPKRNIKIKLDDQ